MAGARDVARVLDARIRHMLDGIQPEPPGPWADRVPDTGSADLDRYLRELAEAMDDRVRRLGEHTAETQPPWARQALGPVPGDPVARLDWEHRASLVAAYRERYGYAHPDDPIGPEPAKASPEARAAWHAALAALGRVDGIDLRGCTDGDLWLRRSTYERETAWAPPHVTEELRLMRTAERDAHVNAVRAEHESRAAKDQQTAERHRQLAGIWRALEAKAAREAAMFAAAQETRRQWETVTETTRRIAIAADLELRRRHPDMHIEPLRPHPAEADGITYPANPDPAHDTDSGVQPTLDGPKARTARSRTGQTQEHAGPSRRRDLDRPTRTRPDPGGRPRRDPRAGAAHPRQRQDRPGQARRPGQPPPSRRRGRQPSHQVLPGPSGAGPDRDAVLQPPRPDVVPSARVLAHHQANAHAAR